MQKIAATYFESDDSDDDEDIIMMMILMEENTDSEDDHGESTAYRASYPRPDYHSSYWFKMLQDEKIQNPSTKEGLQFRRRFAVPHGVFLSLAASAKKWFGTCEEDCAGRKAVPIELKVLGSLRLIAKGWHFDAIAELSGMHLTTMQQWHHDFIERFVEEEFSKWIKHPKTREEAEPIESIFRALGLPGARWEYRFD